MVLKKTCTWANTRGITWASIRVVICWKYHVTKLGTADWWGEKGAIYTRGSPGLLAVGVILWGVLSVLENGLLYVPFISVV